MRLLTLLAKALESKTMIEIPKILFTTNLDTLYSTLLVNIRWLHSFHINHCNLANFILSLHNALYKIQVTIRHLNKEISNSDWNTRTFCVTISNLNRVDIYVEISFLHKLKSNFWLSLRTIMKITFNIQLLWALGYKKCSLKYYTCLILGAFSLIYKLDPEVSRNLTSH